VTVLITLQCDHCGRTETTADFAFLGLREVWRHAESWVSISVYDLVECHEGRRHVCTACWAEHWRLCPDCGAWYQGEECEGVSDGA
jgi:hypothetical protein